MGRRCKGIEGTAADGQHHSQPATAAATTCYDKGNKENTQATCFQYGQTAQTARPASNLSATLTGKVNPARVHSQQGPLPVIEEGFEASERQQQQHAPDLPMGAEEDDNSDEQEVDYAGF